MPFEEKSTVSGMNNETLEKESSNTPLVSPDAKPKVPDTPLEMKSGSSEAESRGEVWIEAGNEQKESALDRVFDMIRSWMPKRRSESNAPSAATGTVSMADADEIAHTADAEERVKKLVNLALVKGVPYAIQVARHIDAYTLDRTHDDLSDKFYDELMQRGMISETDK